MDKVLLTVDEAAQALNTSRWRIFELIRSRRLHSIKLGASRRIPVSAIQEFVEQELQEVSY